MTSMRSAVSYERSLQHQSSPRRTYWSTWPEQSSEPRHPDGVLPFRTEVVVGGQSVGELMLRVSAGMRDTLEYAWWTDEPPAGLPAGGEVYRRST